jgi:hypothetical protein
MKKNICRFSLLALLCCIIISCEKDDIETYKEGYDAIRFPYTDSEPSGYDGQTGYFIASVSFIESPFVSDTIYDLPVMLIGLTKDYDREIPFIINEEMTTAKTGTYEILEAVIPAGELMGHIRFKLSNTEELDEKTYMVYLKLEASEELSVGPAIYLNAYVAWNNSIPAPSNTNHIRTYNMLIDSPLNFISTSTANYSSRALKTIVTALDWYDWDDYSIYGSKYNSATYNSYKYLPRYSMIYNDNSYKSYALKIADYIAKYNSEHLDEPLVHDAGTLAGERIQARSY